MGSVNVMANLYEDIHACRKCPNVLPSVVPRRVTEDACESEIVLMGQAPGEGGARKSGVHWVGPDGRLRPGGVFLDQYLTRLGYSIDPDAEGYLRPYTTNVLHCWTGRNGKRDRPPTACELENCKVWWLREFDLVKPRVVILLGKPAAESFTAVCGKRRSFDELLSEQGKPDSFRDLEVRRYVVPHPTAPYKSKTEPFKTRSQIFEEVTNSLVKVLKADRNNRSRR